MIKWPMKMWLWGKDGIFVASNRPPDPGDDLIAISVYPADQVPEPVACPHGIRHPWECKECADAAPPSTIQQEERERCAKICDRHTFADLAAAAIRATGKECLQVADEEKKG